MSLLPRIPAPYAGPSMDQTAQRFRQEADHDRWRWTLPEIPPAQITSAHRAIDKAKAALVDAAETLAQAEEDQRTAEADHAAAGVDLEKLRGQYTAAVECEEEEIRAHAPVTVDPAAIQAAIGAATRRVRVLAEVAAESKQPTALALAARAVAQAQVNRAEYDAARLQLYSTARPMVIKLREAVAPLLAEMEDAARDLPYGDTEGMREYRMARDRITAELKTLIAESAWIATRRGL